MSDTATCNKCHVNKPLTEFHLSKQAGVTYRRKSCKSCRRASFSAWSKTESGKATKRRGVIMRHYGLTEHEYVAMHEGQGGVCAICSRPETKKHRDGSTLRLSIDHDHVTGEVRGLLCQKCNVGLGSFEDNQASLLLAVEYLRKQTTKNRYVST